VAALYRRHDALRLRFSCVNGVWTAIHVPLKDGILAESCVLETSDSKLNPEFIEQRCARYQQSLNVTQGPLFRAVYLRGTQDEGRLFLVIHHLAVDGVSWRILLHDLEQAYRQVRAAKPIQLGAKTSSYQQWGQALVNYANSDAMLRERAYWHDVSRHKVSWRRLPHY
jgi:NRPS condensation-like uncharacterized protein